MSLDIDHLQRELDELQAAKSTAEERISLFSQRGRGRGRGRGAFPGRGTQRTGDDLALDGIGPALRDRLGTRSSGSHDRRAGSDGSDRRRAGGRRGASFDRYQPDADPAVPQDALPGSNRGRLASAIIADPIEQGQEPESLKRPVDNGNANPAVKQRNKRLFGSLLGTLQKFQEEDQRFKRTKLAQARADAESRAEQRAAEEAVKLKEQQRQDIAKARLEEINKRRELDVKMQAKVHELSIARKIEKEMSLVGWLKTVTHPPLLWLPKLHTEDTQLLLEQRATDLYAWKDAQLSKLESDKAQIQARFKPLEPRAPVRQQPAAAEEAAESADGEAAAEEKPTSKAAEPDRYVAPEGDAEMEGREETPADDSLPGEEATGVLDLL